MRHAEYLGGSGTNVLDFALNITPNDLDLDGISIGIVDSITGLRDFEFSSSITDIKGSPASDIIPALNTNNILIDAKGPQILSYGNLMLQRSDIGLQAVLEVNFAQNVYVTGEPLVPVQLEASPGYLRYKSGSGSKTLIFAATVPGPMEINSVGFRKMTGQVIYLPEGVNINDQLGNNI